MTVQRAETTGPAADPSDAPGDLELLVLRDQIAGVRQSIAIALPVNLLLGGLTYLVAAQSGNPRLAAAWLAAALAVNGVRFAHWHNGLKRNHRTRRDMVRELRLASCLAFLSGFLWAGTTMLPPHIASPDGAFHLIVGAGITGGSIALGFAYAPISICFVTPVLLINAIHLLAAGTLANLCLGATVSVYLIALLRSALQVQTTFVAASRLKHEAQSLARHLRAANARTSAVADEMSHRARHDSLTGLLNRAGFLDVLEGRAGPGSAPTCVLLLDLDGFKSINDVFGHLVGDRVLNEVARRIEALLPSGTAIARIGGDEFAIVFEREDVGMDPEIVAARLIAAISAPFPNFDAGRLGVSIGISEGPMRDAASALAQADEALYAAKSSGRNRHRVFDAALKRRLDTRCDSERDLAAGLESGALQVWYQPIFDEGGSRLAECEALLRWHHPNHGWISPVDVVNAAALSGQSGRLFAFVLASACDMARRLRESGCLRGSISINVSPREMSQLPVDEWLLDALRARDLPASAIQVEITEEMALDVRSVQDKLATLAKAGVRIALDDFGVGYSSLANLRQLRVGRIKVDRTFVTGIASSADCRMLVQAVISLCRTMNLEVVAEGVESADDLLALRAIGCQLMQGYHLGLPMPADELLAIVSPELAEKRPASAA